MSRVADVPRRLVKRVYLSFAGAPPVSARAMARHARAGDLLVLNFHQVTPRPNPFWPGIHPDEFAKLLGWLAEQARVVSFGDLARVGGGDGARPLVILSFDDGYRDFVEYAMPLLDRFGMRANQNVIGESLDTGRPPREVQVCELLAAAPPATLAPLALPGLTASLDGDDPVSQERFGALVSNHVKALPPVEAEDAWDALRTAVGVEAEAETETEMMSIEDVRLASAAGHEIGGHAYSHRSMEHASDDEFASDLARCSERLAAAGCGLEIYAFPNGSHRADQIDALRRAGVEHVLLVGERPSRPDARVHTRITVRGRGSSELRARAAGAVLPHR